MIPVADALADGVAAFDHLSQLSHGAIQSHHDSLLADMLAQDLFSPSSLAAGAEASSSSSAGLPSALVAYRDDSGAADPSWLLQPAREHAQPLWGPPDPYLSAGKSIAPLHPPPAAGLDPSAPAAALFTDLSASPPASPELAERARAAASRGWAVLDASAIRAGGPGGGLPGFAPDSSLGFLPGHGAGLPAETPGSFASQVEWSARFLNVVDRLPAVALLYALLEFLGLRSGVDSYKEDVDADPAGAAADALRVTLVRMGAFAVLAVITLVLFGG
jgi:hypothetical protein